MHKISKLGMMIGVVVIVCSIIRWFFQYPDPSQLILAVSIGIIICLFSYIYNWMKQQEEESNKIDKRIDDLVKWMGKMELQ